MRINLYFIFFFLSAHILLTTSASAQESGDCTHADSTFVPDSTLQAFMHRKYARVELISFGIHVTRKHVVNGDTLREGAQFSMIGRDGLETDRILERVVLKDQDLQGLFDTLFYFHENDLVSSNMMCYEPRNGILFYDQDGEIISFLEICFQCGGMRGFKFPRFMYSCDDHLKIIHAYFNKRGIQLGVTKR